MEHTKEPWSVESNLDNEYFIASKETVCEETTVSKYLSEANARRIVACVNACKGIKTEQLESTLFVQIDAFKDLQDVSHYRDLYKDQRDELYAALTEAAKDFINSNGTRPEWWVKTLPLVTNIIETKADK